jgi:hypothetical protein
MDGLRRVRRHGTFIKFNLIALGQIFAAGRMSTGALKRQYSLVEQHGHYRLVFKIRKNSN